MLLIAALALATPSGRIGSAETGCVPCHGDSADPGTTVTFTAERTVVAPLETINVSLAISTTNGDRTVTGLDVRADDGAWTAGSDTQVMVEEVTHLEPTPMSAGSTVFDFAWTAPRYAGTYTFYGAGLAANDDGTSNGDGWATTTVTIEVVGDDPCVDDDGDGFTVCDGDCDDLDATTYPNAPESCDDVDNNCDSQPDNHPIDGTTVYYDYDGDDYGDDDSERVVCDIVAGFVEVGGDCDDNERSVHPGADEVWYDGVDQDCDGRDDDRDGDGAPRAEDCDDTDPSVILTCDTGDPVDTGETADTGAPKETGMTTPEGCGCATTRPHGLAAALLALLVARRRR